MQIVMIIVRAPLRISFVGGGSDLADFYQRSPGKVISATIDKYVYVALNPAPLLKGIYARYATNEFAKDVADIKNDRIREAMLALSVKDNMEIGVFSHLPVGTGLGASSSFTVALIKGLSTYRGQKLSKSDIAKMACKIEIDKVKDPIGKQDQYATTFGGFNTFEFNSNETVTVEPVLLDYRRRVDFENHLLVFFTGQTRQAASILTEQRRNIPQTTDTLKSMVSLVDQFADKLMKGNFETLGGLLHQNWQRKKLLASNVSNTSLDKLYNVGIKNGAWGGKVLGAGGGGCLMFLGPIAKKDRIRLSLKRTAKNLNLPDFQEIPIKFIHSGVEIVSNTLL